MKKIIRITSIILLVILIVIQFIRPEKNISGNQVSDITTKYEVPADVLHTFKTACYDCHSNHSEYPWYWSIQPVAWFMNGHIEEGKHNLNFNEFASYRIRKQYKTLDDINNQVKEGEMPIGSYKILHKDAHLSEGQKIAIENWTTSAMHEIENTYPPDSLKKK